MRPRRARQSFTSTSAIPRPRGPAWILPSTKRSWTASGDAPPTPPSPAQRATPEAMGYMRSLLPGGSAWFAFGISLHQCPVVAQAVLLGGHPRVGLEDNIYLEKGKLAPSNAALVEKATKIVEILGDTIATPADARAILGLKAATP